MENHLPEDRSESLPYEEGSSFPMEKQSFRLQIPERVFGLTAPQRFIIAILIFLLTTILGLMILISAGKMVLF